MPLVIPFFIPHQGCPHQCLFCNQHSITGSSRHAEDIDREIGAVITTWLGYRSEGGSGETHFAFYGGSFTCLPQEQQIAMLSAVRPWLECGKIDAIRLSTRPDCLDRDRCAILQEYGVGVVELGVQSLDDRVLAASRRGHDAVDCESAIGYLKQAGIEVGIQLMPGLPQEDRSSFRQTVKKTIILHPAFVRLYPALVVEGAELAQLYNQGGYRPLSLEMAVILVAWARRELLEAGIKVVRMGLQPSAALEKAILAGPYHPAFGELVMARDWLRRVRRLLLLHPGKKLQACISPKDLSSFNGIGRSNRERLRSLGLEERLEVVLDENMERGNLQYVVC